VLDFSTLLPGPLATLLLAEAGCEVIKIERPGSGDEMRSYEPRWGPDSINFALLNRGKKSITIDLKDAVDRQRLEPLLARADVLVEQFRPGVMSRLGLDYAAVSAANPRLIYCSISGYGQTGPRRNVAGHDLNYIAETGLLALSYGSASLPVVPPALIADVAGGAYPAVMNILLALRVRDATGRGQYLDIAMADNLFPFMYWAIGNGLVAGRWPRSGAELVTGGSPRYQLYPTKDGQLVAAAPLEQRFWNVFCDVIGLEAVFRDDASDPAAVIQRISEIMASETAAFWKSRFDGRDCCCSIVRDIKEALEQERRAGGIFDHLLARGDGGETLPALPVPIDAAFREPPGTKAAAPALDADNETSST
jgi:crotonobetainyl-CoA:carnitine CoA-transferase CaiB-like acyl-CoA transferase